MQPHQNSPFMVRDQWVEVGQLEFALTIDRDLLFSAHLGDNALIKENGELTICHKGESPEKSVHWVEKTK